MLHHTEGAAEQRFRRRGTKTDDDARLEQRDLRFEPWETGAELAGIRRLVQAAAGARILRPLEVLDGVGDVRVFAGDSGGVEGAIEESPCRTDEWPSGLVFGVARLLADENDPGRARPFAEYGLGGVLVKVAAAARLHRLPTPG